MRLDLKAAARADLEAIHRYGVETHGTQAAEAYLIGLRRTLDRILAHPFSGRVYPGVVPETRMARFRRHQTFYQVDDTMVLIVRVLHERREVGSLLDET